MNNNEKKNLNIEIDDMNIKSHLDTSLDLSGIIVSEDLFNRTLEAIKKQTVEQPTKESYKTGSEKTKTVIAWNKYIRSFAGVAAAAVIVVAGYNLLNNVSIGKNKSEFSTDSVTEDMANQDAFTTESTDINASLSASMDPQTVEEELAKKDGNTTFGTETNDSSDSSANSATEAVETPQFSIAAGVLAADTGEGTSGSSGAKTKVATTTGEASYGFAATAPSDEDNSNSTRTILGSTALSDQTDNSITSDVASIGESKIADGTASDIASITSGETASIAGVVGATALTFRGIFLSDPEQAEYITITDEVNKISVTLTEQVDIEDFYTVMDKHQFTSNTEAATGQNYTVEISDPQIDATYLMAVGDHIIIHYSDQEVTSQSIYDVADSILLSQDLQDLINKYK